MSTFHANDATAYDAFMGRWSQRLAAQFIAFADVAEGDRVLDIGCGTGSLTLAAAHVPGVAEIVGIDPAEPYLAAARTRTTDPRVRFEPGDAAALPFGSGVFDRAFSLLVLQHLPDLPRALAEMRRVVRPGGVMAAAVWDSYGGMPHQRMLWDTAVMVDRRTESGGAEAARARAFSRPMTRSGDLEAAWTAAGLVAVRGGMLTVRVDFANFADYWEPMTAGEGGNMGVFVAALPEAVRARLAEALMRAYCAGRPDGARSFTATAFAVRGIVPER